MAVRLTEDLLRDSISAFTAGERGDDPIALWAMLIFLKKAGQSPETFQKAQQSLKKPAVLASFIEEVRGASTGQDDDLRKCIIEQACQHITDEIRTEIEPRLRQEMETRIVQEFAETAKKELKQSTEEIIHLVKEMDSKLSSHSRSTDGKLETAEIKAECLGKQLGTAHNKLDATTEQLKQASAEISKLKTELEKAGQKGKRDFRVGTAIGILGLIIGLIGLKPMITDFLNKETDEEKSVPEKQERINPGNKETTPKDNNCTFASIITQPFDLEKERIQELSPNEAKQENPKPSKVVSLFAKAKRGVMSKKYKIKNHNHHPHGKRSWEVWGRKQHRPS